MLIRILTMFILCCGQQVMAATVYLNDDRIITGEIVEKNDQAERLKVNGSIVTYFTDEIKNIDGLGADSSKKISKTTKAFVSVNDKKPISATKRELILKFMDVFGTKKALTQNFDALMAQATLHKPEEVQKIKDRIKVDEIIEELVPVYDRNFSEQELKSCIEFYGSQAGQKLIATLPALMKGSIEVSGRYMKSKFPEFVN